MRKLLPILIAIGCAFGGAANQHGMNRDRSEMGLNLSNPLENSSAPPILAFTTVALGGFRGIISNVLWMRATRLQEEEKYFEMVLLADWITKLQPKFATVWTQQAWNMIYNISRTYRDFHDRWLWVESGIKLLRDEGLVYNPTEALLYQELAWTFHDKIGKSTDEAHWYYKETWALKIQSLIGKRPDWEALTNPSNPEQQAAVDRMKEELNMDPAIMREIDELYGPFDWRLSDVHAIYWSHVGLKRVKRNQLVLNRAIWQSLLQSFRQGRVIENYVDHDFELGPDLDIAPKVDALLRKTMEEQPENAPYILKSHRSFLSDAAYLAYTQGRFAEAAQWFSNLLKDYPESVQPGETLALFAIRQIERDSIRTPSRARAIIEGYLIDSFFYAAIGEDDLALGRIQFAKNIYDQYYTEFEGQEARVGLGSFDSLRKQVLELVLTSHPRFSDSLKLQLRTRLGLPAE